MKFIYLSALLCCLSLITVAQQKTDTLFYESFNGQTLDRSKWNVEVTGNTANNEQQAYVDSASVFSLNNGSLYITPLYHRDYTSNMNRKYDFLSARINTKKKFEFTYGTASARIKMPSGAGLWPAFCALGEGKWPDCGEIDIMENIGDSSWVSHALHGPGYFGNTPLVYRAHNMDITQWHVYSVTWSADSIIFSIDGAATYTVTRDKVTHYGKWAFDNPKFIIVNFALGGGYPFGVNQISTPYYGIPQSTVDKVKRGEVKMLVDWVLVTK